ncbi:MAG TPA: ABC transporter ATP-binding protein [Ktedonobacterales bacterium]|nr:ABC transporter ATP-binding protein [Ktedonobacterales bacterium]
MSQSVDAVAAVGAVRPDASSPILQVAHVTHAFGGVNAINDCSLAVKAGKITALIGPNGAGKSTLVNVVSGFYPLQQGTITFDGQSIGGLPAHSIALRGLIRTFQISRDYGAMTVLENLMATPQHQAGENLLNVLFRPWLVAADEKRLVHQALETLNTFGLYDKRQEYARSLSGGQKRLLEMARALMASPKLLLLDEPMAGVNPALADLLATHIIGLRDQGLTVLMIEHNLGIVDQIADDVIVMANGTTLTQGTMAEVRSHPEVIAAYLGGA